MTETSQGELVESACEMGVLEKLADEYLVYCYTFEKNEEKERSDANEGEAKQKKRKSKDSCAKFPNIAGFCRYFGIGAGRYERLAKKFPEDFEKLSALFEDEALNSELSPSLLTAYLKKRLGYGDTSTTEKSEVEAGQLRLVFEHDLMSDGE